MDISEMPEDSDERYLAAMEPSVRILTELADSIRQLSAAMPNVGTQGFAEILDDDGLTSGREGHTSATTHSLSGLALMAASDHVRAFARLHSAAPAPVFADVTLTRAALEALVWARWLGEPGPNVDPPERRRRGLAARLYSAFEEARVPEARESANAKAARLRAVAVANGWTVVGRDRRNLAVGGLALPSIPTEFSRLLVVPVERFGVTLWSHLCGVSHGTLYGLLSGVVESNAHPLDPNVQTAMLGGDSHSVNTLVLLLLRGIRLTTRERLTLMGWQSPAWDRADRNAGELERVLVRALYGINLQ